MRFPEGKRDSISNTSRRYSGTELYRYPSSSSASQSQDIIDDGTTTNGNQPQDDNNIATISEHVLFGNDEGHNSFLYLYYSSSSSNNRNESSSRRPYTTAGSGPGGTHPKAGKMGSGSQQWNDLSGLRSSLGSARPSPAMATNEDYDKYGYLVGGDDTNKSSGMKSGAIKTQNETGEVTPFPVYISPNEEASPEDLASAGKVDEFVRESGRDVRLDSLTAGLLDDDDWDRIYSVPDVASRYLLSPEPRRGTKASNSTDRASTTPREGTSEGGSSSNPNNNNLNVSKISLASSASSSSRARLVNSSERLAQTPNKSSTKRVRVAPQPSSIRRGPPRPPPPSQNEKASGRSSTSTRSNNSNNNHKKLSPVSSSSTSTRSSLKRGKPVNPHGVTHHHHQPLEPGKGNGSSKARLGSSATDGFDQMSFNNGIGAFFGTPASRNIGRSKDITPEEWYRMEMAGWRSRLSTGAMIFTAMLLIMSCSSLLFVFPILVDPILVGFEAQFSSEPVTCRTTNFRNGSGPSECATPSCREGCTLDLFSCMFVDVEYTISYTHDSGPALSTEDPTNHSLANNSNFSSFVEKDLRRYATLLINVNGCGYPPQVTCSDFEHKYAPLNTEFPCFYSRQNESIVVPQYSRRTEIIHLSLAICVPVGVALISGCSLYLLVRYQASLKTRIYRMYAARKKAIKKQKDAEDGLADNDDVEGGGELQSEERVEEEELTSISELEPLGHEYGDGASHAKLLQNGSSRTGHETDGLFGNTKM